MRIAVNVTRFKRFVTTSTILIRDSVYVNETPERTFHDICYG